MVSKSERLVVSIGLSAVLRVLNGIESDIIGIDRVINSVESDISGIESRVSSEGVSTKAVKGCVGRWSDRVCRDVG